MSKNTSQQEQLEMGNHRTSAAHELDTQNVAPKPAASNNDTPFIADQLNVERRESFYNFVKAALNKMHAAFEIFNVAKNVASFSSRPPFVLKGELLAAMEQYLLEGKPLSTADRYALSRVTIIGDYFLYNCRDLNTIDLSPLFNVTTVGYYFLSNCYGLKTIDLSSLSNVTTVGDDFLDLCTSAVQAQGRKFLSGRR